MAFLSRRVFLLWRKRPSHRCLSGPAKRRGPPVSPGLRVGSVFKGDKPRLLLSVSLITSTKAHSFHALVDSGAEQNLIDTEVAKSLNLPLTQLEPPIPASALNNEVFAMITHQTAPVKLVTSGNHQENITLFTTSSLDAPVILGFPWLQKHNPHIDWTGKRVASWSLFCLANCLKSALPLEASNSPLSVVSPPDLSAVPPEYDDIQEVFSKDRAQSLPPHRLYDCAIDLLPGAPLPSSRLYNLSRPERGTMEKYIRESLAAGLIRPSSSPVAAGFFFVSKKDKTLRPCIDYRGLNAITIKNKYPLPLINSAFEPPHGATIFSKLDLRNAYHLVRIREGDEWETAFNTPLGHFEYLVMPLQSSKHL